MHITKSFCHITAITLIFVVYVLQWSIVPASIVKKNMQGTKESFEQLSKSLSDPRSTRIGQFSALSIMEEALKNNRMDTKKSNGKSNYENRKIYVEEEDGDAFVPFSARMVAPSMAPEPLEGTSCWKRKFKFWRKCVEICYDYVVKGTAKIQQGPVYLRYCHKYHYY